MSRLYSLLITTAVATFLLADLSPMLGNKLLAQPINGYIVLDRDGVEASDFDGAQYKIPFATILYQSDEGPNFFLGHYQGKCVALERDSIVPVRTARERVAEAATASPSDENFALLAKIELFLRNLEPARDAADQALQLNPLNVDATFVLAEVSYRESEYEDCRVHCDDALANAPDRLDIMARRAATLANLGQSDEAIAVYEKVLELDPHMAPAWSNMGVYWQYNGDMQKAIECYEKAVAIDPGYWHGWFCLANTEADDKEAMEFWKHCIECGPNTYTPWYYAAIKFVELDDLGGYHRSMRLAVQFPDCPEHTKQMYAMRLATTSRDEFRDGQAALDILKGFTDVDGSEVGRVPFHIVTCIAATYAELGDFEKAKQMLVDRPELAHNPEAIRMFESYQEKNPWRVDY